VDSERDRATQEEEGLGEEKVAIIVTHKIFDMMTLHISKPFEFKAPARCEGVLFVTVCDACNNVTVCYTSTGDDDDYSLFVSETK